MDTLKYVNISEEHAEPLSKLQRICFPTTDVSELFDVEDLLQHVAVFPEGTFVVLDGERVVGLGAGIFVDFDFEHPQHTLYSIAGESGVEKHDPAGLYYYGTDISVHPEYRRRGIGKKLYQLRKDITCRYNKKGIVAGGVLPGFADHKTNLSALEYVTQVAAGDLYDPTLSFQIKNGFEVRGVLEDYFHDERSGNWASLIYWENPDYREEG